MKRASKTSILSQNNKACNVTNELVKIVISLHCVAQFLADRTNGRAIATLLRLSSSSVCLWRYVLWLNGAS